MKQAFLAVAVCALIYGCSGIKLRFRPPISALIIVSVSGTLKKDEPPTQTSVKLFVQRYSNGNPVLKLVTNKNKSEISFVVSRRMGLLRKPQLETAESQSEADVMEGMAFAAMVAFPFTCEWLPKNRISLGDSWMATPPPEQATSLAIKMRFAAQENELLRLEGVPSETAAPMREIRAVRLLWDRTRRVPRILEFEGAGNRKLRYTFSLLEGAE